MSFSKAVSATLQDSKAWYRQRKLSSPLEPAGHLHDEPPPTPPLSVITSKSLDSDGGFSSVSQPHAKRGLIMRGTPSVPLHPDTPGLAGAAIKPISPEDRNTPFTARESKEEAAAAAQKKQALDMRAIDLQRQLASMEGDMALLRSQNRQLSSLQAAYEREIVAHRQRESAISADLANKDGEIGRLRAAMDRVEMEKRSLKGEVESSKDAKALVEEEVKLLRQSLAMQEFDRLKRMVSQKEDECQRLRAELSKRTSPFESHSVVGSVLSTVAPPILLPSTDHDRAAHFSSMARQLETELAVLRADTAAEIQRLDSFLVLAGQENSALRRQLMAAGITPDVVNSDGSGAGVMGSGDAIQMRRGLVVSMLAERAAKTKADADREAAQAQLAQLEATLAVERSEKATLERQLADALLAVELTHAEASKESSQLAALRQELAGKDAAIEAAKTEAAAATADAEKAREDLRKHNEYSALLEQSLAAIQEAMAEAEGKIGRVQDENKALFEEAERCKSLAEAATAHIRGTIAAQQEALQSAVDTAVLEATDRVSEAKSREISQLERETDELRRIVALLEDENRACSERYDRQMKAATAEHREAQRLAREDKTRMTQLLEKRRADHESEIKELEQRFTTMLQQRQQSYERELTRVREDAAEQVKSAVNREVARVRSDLVDEMEGALRAQRAELGSPVRRQAVEQARRAWEMEQEANLSKLKQEHERELTATVTRIRRESDHDARLAQTHAQMAEQMDALQSQLTSLKTEVDKYKDAYAKESRRRRAAHERLMDLQGNIRVHARVRPATKGAAALAGMTDLIKCNLEGEMWLRADGLVGDHRRDSLHFEFDAVHQPSATQSDVFTAVRPMCESALDGYNVCIFAYGQTGSGKTYTMEGEAGDPGVTYRAVETLFQMVDERGPDAQYTFKISMLEVYMERVRDLLEADGTGDDKAPRRKNSGTSSSPSRVSGTAADSSNDGLVIRESATGCEIVGLTQVAVRTSEDVYTVIARGAERRAIGTHSMNEHSSRSHMVIRVHIDGTLPYGVGKAKFTGAQVPGGGSGVMRVQSVLNLIDLAGSERVLRTEVAGQSMKEAQSINKSLSALGDVIAAHKTGSSHVPYRNSKLTFLLKDSLGGDAKVLMFVNVSGDADNLNETFCSLTFASRCRAVSLGQAKRHISSLKSPTSVASASSRRSLTKRLSDISLLSEGSSHTSEFDDGGTEPSESDGLTPHSTNSSRGISDYARSLQVNTASGKKPSVGRPPLGSTTSRF